MAGDHKCPVCQSTFTRPQHVARHMRSHTGDRPYKCQYCGDQFARSDLLSRHVNKCHAAEKAANTGGPGRRKGQGVDSATRATTSKQACDDCVQQNLPCDGGNPCGKCIQRKARCTYVKFQRQTAPRGPGHRTTQSEDSTASTSTFAGRGTNELYPGGPSLHVPGISSNLYVSNLPPQSFAFSSPLYRQSLDPRAATDSPQPQPDDYSARFRANAEMLQRTGNLYPTSTMSNSMLYNDPQDRQPTLPWVNGTQYGIDFGLSQGLSSPDYAASNSGMGRFNLQQPYSNGMHYPSQSRRRSLDHSDGSTASHSVPSSAASSSVQLPLSDLPSHAHVHGQGHNIPGLDPSQAPMMTSMALGQNNVFPTFGGRPDMSHVQQQQQQYGAPVGEGMFSSAFGLMSLDDENVLAGISSDGVPFFSSAAINLLASDAAANAHAHSNASAIENDSGAPGDPNHPNNNSINNSGHPAKSPSTREAELKELRDFWKQYMRTPLTGSTPRAENGSYILTTPHDVSNAATSTNVNGSGIGIGIGIGTGPGAGSRVGSGSGSGSGRPSPPKRGLSRVASLPNVKTPTDEHQANAVLVQGGANNGHVNNIERGRAKTGHDGEDLRSYEQAVLARKAPTLNFNPIIRRPRHSASPKMPPARALPIVNANAGSSGGGPMPPPLGSMGTTTTTTSSLAHAFSEPPYPPNIGPTGPPDPSLRLKLNPSSRPPSRDRQGVAGGLGFGMGIAMGMGGGMGMGIGMGGGLSDTAEDMSRPNFKRLPSQTLGPINPKRTLFARPGDREENMVRDGEFVDGEEGEEEFERGGEMERERRMSGGGGGGEDGGGERGDGHGHEMVGVSPAPTPSNGNAGSRRVSMQT